MQLVDVDALIIVPSQSVHSPPGSELRRSSRCPDGTLAPVPSVQYADARHA